MRRTHRFLAAVALAGLPACGVPTEQYDARTNELRQAEDKVRSCDGSIKAEQTKTSEAQANLEEMRGVVREQERERKELGIRGPADVAALRGAAAEAAKNKQASAEHKSERERLSQNLKAELDGGVIWLDERGGVLRLVMPEEALFGSNNANIGPPGKKVLDSVVRELKAMPPRELEVAAFLDRTAKSKADKDMALTLDRAWHVADYFTRQGIDKAAVAAAGFGELEPIADNESDSARARNRRVEILLLAAITPPAPTPPPIPVAAPAQPARPTQPTARPVTATPAAGITDDPGM